ncbi:MAG TPA: pyruvate kinase [Isosphaeraceae bacterium]|nr:pyruvate kinase [Isosphaeraceae bacterium]
MDKTIAQTIASLHKEQLGKVRTKIVATVGPASSEPSTLNAMVEAGVDVFRLNFSHGVHSEHSAALETIRRIGLESGRQIAVLQDLCGPKIRLGTIPDDVVACDHDSEFVLAREAGVVNDPHQLSSSYPALADDLEVGQTVLFADGTVAMEVIERGPGWARLKVVLPGLIRSHQGINVPSAGLSVAALTDKDLADLDWTATHPVDYVGLSFARKAADIVCLRRELDRRGIRARIIAKIEKPQALENLDSIIAEADAVMVARGDLGVELDVTRVPAIQKQIISACHYARVPVITATQMLNSMETTSRPTRAEANDVFNAVLDGTDAVMLSGETAIGQYPVESVSMMSRIVGEGESLLFSRLKNAAPWTCPIPSWPAAGVPGTNHAIARAGLVKPITESVVEAASQISRRLNAALLIVATYSGRTALVLSKQRNPAPTLALAHDAETARAMSLFWGVTPLPIPQLAVEDQLRTFVLEWCKARGLIGPGDCIVGIRGAMPSNPAHNEIVVHEVL